MIQLDYPTTAPVPVSMQYIRPDAHLNQGAAVEITTIVVLTVLVAVSKMVSVAVAVSVNETVVCSVTVEVAGANGLVMKQLHAELMRVAGTVAR